jgi:serine/threonine protein kinase
LVIDEDAYGPPEIALEDIQMTGESLGAGANATVAVGLIKGKRFAIKTPKRQSDLTDAQLEAFRREVLLQKKIFHPNCALLIGACSVRGSMRIVVELCNLDLDHLLKNRSIELSLYQKLTVARDTAAGLAWLHDIVELVHREYV